MSNKMFYFGHHKCASRFFRKLNRSFPVPHSSYGTYIKKKVSLFDLDELDLEIINIFLEGKNAGLFSVLNSTQKILDRIEAVCGMDFHAYHIIRDPRDILISAYFHHREGHPLENDVFIWPELGQLREQLLSSNEEEGMLAELNSITKKILDRQYMPLWWKNKDNILTIKLENFTRNQDFYVSKIVRHLGIKNLSSINIPLEKTGADQNRKSNSDWRDYFTPKIKKIFKEYYGQLLIDLDYATDFNW